MTPEAGLARPADGGGASDKAPIDPDIDLHARSPRGETRTRWTLLIAIAIGGVVNIRTLFNDRALTTAAPLAG